MSAPRTLHHIVADAVGPTKTTISSYTQGQVFIRQGAPCMVVRGPGIGSSVCNLLTGAVWEPDPDEFVEPAYRVKLRYERTSQ